MLAGSYGRSVSPAVKEATESVMRRVCVNVIGGQEQTHSLITDEWMPRSLGRIGKL